jgi:hypothetical protein
LSGPHDFTRDPMQIVATAPAICVGVRRAGNSLISLKNSKTFHCSLLKGSELLAKL